jgi:hypothetical protein
MQIPAEATGMSSRRGSAWFLSVSVTKHPLMSANVFFHSPDALNEHHQQFVHAT